MVTELQQKIYDELNKYTSTEIMQEAADSIAKICGCSKAYVLRMIKKKKDSGAKIQIKVAPPEPEPEEDEKVEEPIPEEHPEEDAWMQDFEEETEREQSVDPEKPAPEQMPLGDILTKENVEMLISVPFRMAADFTGWDGAELTADEKKRLTPMARAIMLKYVPDLMQMYFVEIVFILIVGEIVVAKYRAYGEFASEQQSKKEAQEKAAQQAEIAERRKLEQEQEDAKKDAKVPPEEPKPLTKEEAGDPSWNKPGGFG